MPIIETELGDDFLLQQDNSLVHTSSMIMDYFDNAGILSLSDLNIMENIWSMISNDIYDSQQPKNKSELKEKIDEAVSKIYTLSLIHI